MIPFTVKFECMVIPDSPSVLLRWLRFNISRQTQASRLKCVTVVGRCKRMARPPHQVYHQSSAGGGFPDRMACRVLLYMPIPTSCPPLYFPRNNRLRRESLPYTQHGGVTLHRHNPKKGADRHLQNFSTASLEPTLVSGYFIYFFFFIHIHDDKDGWRQESLFSKLQPY